MAISFKSFSVCCKFNYYDVMFTVGFGGGGKGDRQGGGWSEKGNGQGNGSDVVWSVEDYSNIKLVHSKKPVFKYKTRIIGK